MNLDTELNEILGVGGSGTVYAVTLNGRRLAVKVLHAELALSSRERRRFDDEVARMGRVNHPGLIRVESTGTLADGRPYIAMPRLEGETLAARLGRGRMSIAEALGIFQELAGSVAALHGAGLLHRDIKPENIFLERGASVQSHPVLLDFGIARDTADGPSTTTAAGQTRGTPAYMAPERFFGARATIQSDVYELAVTLYLMLVGRSPWGEIQSASARLSPLDPRAAGIVLPEGLPDVLLGALSTRPEARPASAQVFADSVRESLANDVLARTTAPVEVYSPTDATHFAGAPRSVSAYATTQLSSTIGGGSIAPKELAKSAGPGGRRTLYRRLAPVGLAAGAVSAALAFAGSGRVFGPRDHVDLGRAPAATPPAPEPEPSALSAPQVVSMKASASAPPQAAPRIPKPAPAPRQAAPSPPAATGTHPPPPTETVDASPPDYYEYRK